MNHVISMNAVAAVAFDPGGMLGYDMVNLASIQEYAINIYTSLLPSTGNSS